jgi:hypothetical protein
LIWEGNNAEEGKGREQEGSIELSGKVEGKDYLRELERLHVELVKLGHAS